MKPRLLRFLYALALSASLVSGQTAALAQETPTDPGTIGGSGDNVAVAVNTKDGSSKAKVSFRIVKTSADVIDNGNVAVAFASCEGCRSVAIAVQVVLVGGSPSTVIPENYAIALNFECVDCEALASAYQFVLGADGKPHFTAAGNVALAEIRKRIRELSTSEMPVEEIQAELDLLAADLRDVLSNELVSANPESMEVEEVEAPASADASPEGEPVPSETSSPVEEPSPSPATEETSEPVATPSPEASTTPSVEPSPTPTASSSP